MKRYLISVLLAVLCLTCMFTVLAAEQSTADQTEYTDELGLLLELGVMSETSDFTAQVLRGEFVECAMKLSGYANVDPGLSSPYSDVLETDSWYSAVVLAHSLGYIEGSGEFKPKENVSFYEAADLLTGILGYVYVRESAGEKNPMTAAYTMGLFDGITASPQENITRGDMIKMFYHALFINVMKPISYSGQSDFELESGEMLLVEVFHVYKGEGQVEATPLTSIYTDEGCGENRIEIGGILYRTEEAYFDFIGHTVTYFYRREQGMETVIYLHDKYPNAEFSVDFDRVSQLTETQLLFSEDKKDRKKTIEKYATFLYNGKLKDFAAIDTNVSSGNVTLIDSDNDDRYEIVNITEYVHGVVSGFSKGEFQVYTQQNRTFDLKAEKGIRMVEIYAEGALAEFDAIQTGKLVSVAETAGAGLNRIRVYVSTNAVEGTVVSVDEERMQIDDTSYPYACADYTPAAGDYGTFYIGVDGKVVIAKLENYVVYGFLYKMQQNGLGPVEAKIFSDRGRWVEVELADQVQYNGERKNAEYLMSAPELIREGSIRPQLITYRVNSEKKLIVLNTAKTVKRWSDEEKEAMDNATFRYVDVGSKNLYYRNNLKTFNLEAYIDESTYIFVIPGSEGDTDFDTSGVYLANVSSFVGDRQYTGLNFYDMDEWGNVNAMVIYGSAISEERSIYPVVGTGKGLDEAGNVCDVVYIMFGGYRLGMTVTSSFDFAALGLKKGDVIRYAANNDGSIGNISLMFRPGDPEYEDIMDQSNIYHSNLTLSGTIERVDLSRNKALVKNGEKKYVLDLSSVSNAYLFSRDRESARKIAIDEVPQNVQAFMYVQYGRIIDLVVYES